MKENYTKWLDADFSDVISQCRRYFEETANYNMAVVDAAKSDEIMNFPIHMIVILYSVSMYSKCVELETLLYHLQEKITKS